MPEATVAAIITTKDGSGTKILLTRRDVEPFKGQWCLPGGHINRYESAKDAITREVKEETGLDFDGRFFSYFDESIQQREIHAVVTVFEGPAFGVASAQKGEVAEIRWFSITEAQSMPLAFTHNKILDVYVNRKVNPKLRTEILKEYSVLKDEILKRTEIRHQLLSFTLVAAGTFLTIGAQGLVEPSVLLIYPILATFLAAVWTHSDIRVGELGEYIRTNIEPRLDGLRWEKHLRKKYGRHENWLLRRLMEFSASGIFLTTEILAVVFATYHPRWTSSREQKMLLILDGIAITMTFLLILLRRKMYRGSNTD